MDEADVYLSAAPGASEYRFANAVVVDGSDTMIYLDFSQLDPKIDDRAVIIARALASPTASSGTASEGDRR
jgi:hypothetical protein